MILAKFSFALAFSLLLGLLVLAASPSPVFAANGVDKAANRVSRDRWARTEPASTKSSSSSSSSFTSSSPSSDDEEDAEEEKEPEKPKREEKVNVKHDGELNGKVSIDAW